MNSLQLTEQQIAEFQKVVLQKGKDLYREMPWRNDTNPYFILLSEIMLQQTQVPRVLLKFDEFITAFPTLQTLADADFQEVLMHWSGLGYNRRARFLHQMAKQIVALNEFPQDVSVLQQNPGIGENTAASILVYAFNKPLVFLETNVRTVLIYSFFQDCQEKVEENALRFLAEQTLYKDNPRQWYWALMDYGTHLKKTVGNYNRMSTKHTTQSKFEGSFRQKRASILRCLLKNGPLTCVELSEYEGLDVDLANQVLETLLKDSLVVLQGDRYIIA